MRAQLHPHERTARSYSTRSLFVTAFAAVGLLVGLFAVAAAPGVTLMFVAGALTAQAVNRIAAAVANGGLRIPGTNRRLRPRQPEL